MCFFLKYHSSLIISQRRSPHSFTTHVFRGVILWPYNNMHFEYITQLNDREQFRLNADHHRDDPNAGKGRHLKASGSGVNEDNSDDDQDDRNNQDEGEPSDDDDDDRA